MNVIDRLHNRMKAKIRWLVRNALFLDKITQTLTPDDTDEISNPSHLARSTIIFGVWMVVLVFGVFGIWSVLAKIDSAAIAPGRVVVDSNRKTIDHLEGGIVEAIMVTDGTLVEKGAELVRLREIRAKAQMELIKDQYYTSLATEARLLTERDMAEEIAFPEALITLKDMPEIAEIMDSQRRIFESRTENIRGQLDIGKTRVAKHEQEIKGLQMQADAMEQQIELLNEEIEVVEELLKQGNTTKQRLLSLKRQRAELQGRQGEYLALKAKARESIDETRLTILNTESEYMNDVVEQLREAQLKLAEAKEKMTASEDVLNRVVIRAPERGIVNDLAIHTVGGVVKPGEKILDIIPLDDKLIVEARISPQDIDVVRQGLKARVRLTAYKARQVPAVNGEVIFVSADQFIDERTGQSYFLARIGIDQSELDELKGIDLYPGMPADTLIITGSRTFLAYMLGPITDSFQHSFRQD